MLRAAVLRTKNPVVARLTCLEPSARVAAGEHVHLDAERGNKKIVNHVLGCHRQLYGPADGDVQLVDLALPFGMLDLPHPLTADDGDLERTHRRLSLVQKNRCAPEKQHHRDAERHRGPKDFKCDPRLAPRATLVPGRRRYLMEKKTITNAIKRPKNSDSATRK